MKPEEIEVISKRIYAAFGRRLGLNSSKIRKCVSAIANLHDAEINTKLKKLFY